MNRQEILLDVNGLRLSFRTARGTVQAVSDASFQVWRGEVTGIVGESGSGKSVTARALLGLLPGNATVEAGAALFCGNDLLSLGEKKLRKIRGSEISMIFQDPMTALDPAFTIGSFLTEVLRSHDPSVSRRAAWRRSVQMLTAMGIREPEDVMRRYPDSLSGGMCQRVMIAAALLCGPQLLIADEPTTALDVTIQEEILSLLQQLKEKQGMSILFITHDFGVVARLCDRVAVMYGGFVMESGTVDQIFYEAAHPYTQALLSAIPIPDPDVSRSRKHVVLEGEVPSPINPPKGCKFHTRCPYATELCRSKRPETITVEPGHTCACHKVANDLGIQTSK